MKKNIKLVGCLFVLLFLSACSNGEHDGKVVQDSSGNIYILSSYAGSTYFLERADMDKLAEINALIERGGRERDDE